MIGRTKIPLLSKSRFMAGIQCHKRLYLELYQRDLADEVTPAQQAVFDQGTAVGELARKYFPGGVLIEEDHTRHDAAMRRTRGLLADPSVPALYEAAFRHDDIRVRVDLLKRNREGTFDLVEVKSTSSPKPEHHLDIAIQAWVLQQSGIRLGKVGLLHVNTSYVYPGGDHDPQGLLALADLTGEIVALLPQIPELLAAMRAPLRESEAPAIAVGDQCHAPYDCPFISFCHADQPEHPVTDLQRPGKALKARLADDGIAAIPEIPEEYEGLSAINERIRQAVVSGEPYHDPAIASVLSVVRRPIYFIDFEAFNPAIPRYIGTHPYEMIPFQWSAHRLEADGSLQHGEYLHRDVNDPRIPFVESLLDFLEGEGEVCVYSHFEKTQLTSISSAFPEYAERIGSLIDRLLDLLPLVREHVYHPEFHGSFSIKSVLPALVPEAGYGDLAISDGASASAAFVALVDPSTLPPEQEEIANNLRRYCERDSEALVKLYKSLANGAS